MGQRFQMYVQYTKKEARWDGGTATHDIRPVLIPLHLQWSYGAYSVIRADQLLRYIYKNIHGDDEYGSKTLKDVTNHRSDFIHEPLRGDSARKTVRALLEVNQKTGSYQYTMLLVDLDDFSSETYTIDPTGLDNNDGCLIVKISEDGFIKYGFYSFDKLYKGIATDPISAEAYLEPYAKFEERENDEDLYLELQLELDLCAKFELLTQEEVREIFATEYWYKDIFPDYEKRKEQQKTTQIT